jgi:hypothetical protein
MIVHEYRVRRRHGDRFDRDEYLSRFESHAGELCDEFSRVDHEAAVTGSTLTVATGQDKTPPAQAGTLRVRCPHCHHPIELVAEDFSADTDCPSCGTRFNLVRGREGRGRRDESARIAHFELLERVGMGSYGTVWKAWDTRLERTVAVKIPRKGQQSAAETEQFLREARAAAQARHANIVSVHEVGRESDGVYIVSDFIQGVTLGEWIGSQGLTPREAAELCRTIAGALHAAHEVGVVHRDLKPSNVLIDSSGKPYLTDFGLAKREDGITMTVDGDILGTPAYMSPEQARGEAHRADRRSDVYSLGVILYELLVGERPYRGNPQTLIVQVLYDEPARPRKLDAGIPRDLESICLKCLEKAPERRYATALELADDLGRFVNGRPVLARPQGAISRMWRWYRRSPVATAWTAGGFSALCGIMLLIWGIMGVLLYAFQLHPTTKGLQASRDIALLIVFLYLPMIWSGVRTLNDRVGGLYLGGLLWAGALAASVAGLTGYLGDVETFGSLAVRLPLFVLLTIVSLAGLILHVTAIISRGATAGQWEKRP